MAPVFGYWDHRGVGQPIRFLLHHVGVEFEDKMFKLKGMEDFQEWNKKKHALGLEFPNLPYYIDEDVKITQSLAILRYLARKHDLFPKEANDIIRAEMLEQLARDVNHSIIFQFQDSKQDNAKKFGEERLVETLKMFSDTLGQDDFYIGNRLTYVDFLVFESLDHVSYLMPDVYIQYPNIGKFAKRIESLPNIKKMIEDGKFQRWPLYGPFISWGGAGEEPQRRTQ